jgi:hypothetical protein
MYLSASLPSSSGPGDADGLVSALGSSTDAVDFFDIPLVLEGILWVTVVELS